MVDFSCILNGEYYVLSAVNNLIPDINCVKLPADFFRIFDVGTLDKVMVLCYNVLYAVRRC